LGAPKHPICKAFACWNAVERLDQRRDLRSTYHKARILTLLNPALQLRRRAGRLCTDDPEAAALLEEALLVKQGNPTGHNQYTEDTGIDNNVNNSIDRNSPVGNTRAAGLRRLRKDRPDLHERIVERIALVNGRLRY
jgi:hypothetical protein